MPNNETATIRLSTFLDLRDRALADRTALTKLTAERDALIAERDKLRSMLDTAFKNDRVGLKIDDTDEVDEDGNQVSYCRFFIKPDLEGE
jgi:hypothetical protein